MLDKAQAPAAPEVQVEAEEIHPGLAGAVLADYTVTGQPYTGLGVMIESVAERSPAGFAGLRPNDIIVQVNRVSMRNTDELRAAASEQDMLVITARRGNRMIVLQVR
ncbi:MAG: PDZ domain-containing protein [Chromatiales bacterium]|nr:PDZ domain-containing protein [Chromatiales bacterium]